MIGAIFNGWTLVILLSMTPFSELRGAIITGLGLGLNPFFLFWLSIFFNGLIFLPIFFGLKLFYVGILSRSKSIKNIVERSRDKTEKFVQKYGVFGLILFVGIPLPFSGAWTASIAAWMLGMDWEKAWIAIFFGLMISATIVMFSTFGVIKIFG